MSVTALKSNADEDYYFQVFFLNVVREPTSGLWVWRRDENIVHNVTRGIWCHVLQGKETPRRARLKRTFFFLSETKGCVLANL